MENSNFKPMLAATWEGQLLRLPVLASPKLDGVRAIVLDGVVYSRNLKPIPNAHVQKLFGRSPYLHSLDGELIVGDPTHPHAFRNTSSGVMSRSGEPDVQFHVFDVVESSTPFSERFDYLKRYVAKVKPVGVQVVPHLNITDFGKLDEFEAQCLADGYEGVMLRSPGGPYKFGRSTVREGHLLKLKRFMDSEAVIDSVEELQHNDNEQTRDELGRSKRSSAKGGKTAGGTLGALGVRDVQSGVSFQVGTGWTADERARLWAIRSTLPGLVVRYRYFPSGSKDKPRFPVFVGFRDRIDF